MRPFLPLKVMRNVYYSLIYSHIIYAIEAWGSACKTELNKILTLQKRAMRLMTYNDKYPATYGPLISSDPIFTKLEILKVSEIYKYQVDKLIYKCINAIAVEHYDMSAMLSTVINVISFTFMLSHVFLLWI